MLITFMLTVFQRSCILPNRFAGVGIWIKVADKQYSKPESSISRAILRHIAHIRRPPEMGRNQTGYEAKGLQAFGFSVLLGTPDMSEFFEKELD